MKLNMNTAAIGFAIFAAWYVLKGKTATAATGGLFGQRAAQQKAVEDAAAAQNLYGISYASGAATIPNFFNGSYYG